MRALGIVAAVLLLSLPLFLISTLVAEASGVSALTRIPVLAAVGAVSDAAAFLFYVDLRVRKEAFDLEHLATLVEQRGPAA
jgi:hypothetical protein